MARKQPNASAEPKPRRPIFPVVSDEVFTDREDLLRLLKDKALAAKRGRDKSTVLIGHRRVGKTELLRRLYNRLFWEQDEVVPIYITFEELNLLAEEFASEYIEIFLSQYVGFKRKDAVLAARSWEGRTEAKALIAQEGNDGLHELLHRYESVEKRGNHSQQLLTAIQGPRLVSDENQEPIFVMLDEFQHVIDIHDREGGSPNPVGRYQTAVESRHCPHLVTGSAVTLLTKDIIGRGPLYGRFRAEYIRGLDGYYVMELAQRLSRQYGVAVTPETAGELDRRTGGNPCYLDCIFAGAQREGKHLDSMDRVNEVISYELTQGGIWAELYRQLNYYFTKINEKGVTKNIFYFASRHQDEEIDPAYIAKKMSHWGVDEENVREVLLALSRADLIEERVAGTEFYNVKDPILREFADAWARVDVEASTWEETEREFIQRYRKATGRLSDLRGYTTELMIKFMMTRFDGREVDAKAYFGASRSKAEQLRRFQWVDSRKVKLPSGPEYEIDIVGAGVPDVWFVEVKHTQKPVGISQVRKFERACRVAAQLITGEVITRWYVSVAGFTKQATAYLRKNGFLYSTGAQVNALLESFGLRKLPVM